MTIDEAYRYSNMLANKDQRGGLSPVQWNLSAERQQLAYIAKRDVDHPHLTPLLVERSPLTVDNTGKASRPADWLRTGSLVHKYTKPVTAYRAATPVTRNVDVLGNSAFDNRLDSRLTGPTKDYPIATTYTDQAAGAAYFRCAPADLGTVHLSYLKKPTAPKWNYEEVADEAVFKLEGSVDFSIHEDAHNILCVLILADMGINLSQQTLIEFGLLKESQAQ